MQGFLFPREHRNLKQHFKILNIRMIAREYFHKLMGVTTGREPRRVTARLRKDFSAILHYCKMEIQ